MTERDDSARSAGESAGLSVSGAETDTQTDAAEVLPGTWRNHDDPRDEWPGADDWNPEYVAGMLADAEDEFWTAYHRICEWLGEDAAVALGSVHDAMARRIFTGPELAAREAAARAEAWDEGWAAGRLWKQGGPDTLNPYGVDS